jgi:hypothetical protein
MDEAMRVDALIVWHLDDDSIKGFYVLKGFYEQAR